MARRRYLRSWSYQIPLPLPPPRCPSQTPQADTTRRHHIKTAIVVIHSIAVNSIAIDGIVIDGIAVLQSSSRNVATGRS